MKAAIIKGALLAASLILFCGYAWDAPRGQAGAGPGPKAAQARALFEERCAKCHGRDGRGQTKLGEMLEPPDFTNPGWQEATSDERMRQSIRDGVGQMPAFARKLSRREVTALVAYVRGFAKPDR
ncbi:MAG TPA: c-type cytochrome [Pyrinomonadaceae bacterium]|nr:c-type cytochrome [Pyrinomonadaceae bacterium]